MILVRAWLSAIVYSDSAKLPSVLFSLLVRVTDCTDENRQ